MEITLTSGGSPVTTGEPDNPIILKKDAAAVSLTASVSGYGTGVSYSWSSTGTAIAPVSGNGPTKTLTPNAGGTSTVTVTATITAASTSKTLSKTVTVAVVEAVIKQGGSELASNSITSLGFGCDMNVTAELTGGITASWNWTSAAASPAGAVTFNKTNAASVKITGSTLGKVNVTATATFGGGQQCSRTIQIEVKLTSSGLDKYLESLENAGNCGSKENPIQIPEIQDLTVDDWNNRFSYALAVYDEVYVDLSLTQLPEGVTNMQLSFWKRPGLVIPPKLPSSVTILYQCFAESGNLTAAPDFSHCTAVTNMESCFSGCTSLTTGPNLSACTSLTTMKGCFASCTSLTTAPVMPASVTDMSMEACFHGCTSLTDVSGLTIPAGVTDMKSCFYGCTNLTTAPVIPDSVTDMESCFYNCTNLTTAPVIPDSVTDIGWCFDGCANLSGTIIINAHITSCSYAFRGVDPSKITKIKVPDASTQNTLRNSNGMPEALKAKILCPGDAGYDD